MKGIPATTMQMPGFPVQEVNSSVQISNLMTILLAGNHRPTEIRPFDHRILDEWLTTAVATTDDTDFEILSKMVKGGEQTNKQFNSPLQLFLASYAEQAAALMCKPRYTPDVSFQMRKMLLETPFWDTVSVSSPSLGYAREYVRWTAPTRMSTVPLGLPAYPGTAKQSQSPNPETDANPADTTLRKGIAITTAIMDIPALSEQMIPEAKSLTRRHEREPYWGTAEVALEQNNRLTAAGLLWMCQADAYGIRRHKGMWDKMYEIASAFYPRERPILDMMQSMREHVLATVPCAPWLETLTNMNLGLTVSTVYGDHPLIVQDPSDVLENLEGNEVPLGQLFLAMAMTDYNRFRALKAAGVDWPGTMLDIMIPDVDPKINDAILNLPPGTRTVGSLVEWLAINQRYVERWPDIVRSLGWSGAIAPTSYNIDQMGCDFVLCDGDTYSDHPYGLVSGMRPGLSVGNKRILGFARRLSETFNTGGDVDTSIEATNGNGGDPEAKSIIWSTVVLRGHITAAIRDLALTRFYMPEGMWMGEDGGETRFADPVCLDDIGQAVITMYRQYSPSGYVRRGYNDPTDPRSRISPSLTYLRTDWDAWTYGDEPDVAQNALLTAYGSRNVEGGRQEPLNVFLWRQEGWNMRVPVQLARTYELKWYDELGKHADTLDYEGFVLFDDTLSLMSDKSPVDALVELVKTRPPKLEPKVNAEAEAPEIPKDL